MENKLEVKIKKLEDELKKKKALQQLKINALKTKENKRARAQRDFRLCKHGGLIEKMGLHLLSDEILIASLLKTHKELATKNPEELNQFKRYGEAFMPHGKRLEPLNPGVATPDPAN